MQLRTQPRPAPGIIFDADFGSGVEPVLALALLYGFDGKNEIRVVNVSVSRHDVGAAAFVDAIAKFYAAGGFSRTLPVGMSIAGKPEPTPPVIADPLAKKNPEGQPLYTHSIHSVNDTAEVGAVLRSAFTAQHDGNVSLVVAGPATNVAELLKVAGAREVVERKCSRLVIAAGSFPDGAPDPHVVADIPAAKKMFSEWPGEIVAVGQEVGNEVRFPAEAIEKDFAWSQAHPIADAYKAGGKMPYEASTWEMAAVTYAVRPEDAFFRTSEPGVITVAEDGRTSFRAAPDGRHRYLVVDPSQKDKLLALYREVVSAKPVPRRPRFPGQQQQQQQQTPPAKPGAAKPPSDR